MLKSLTIVIPAYNEERQLAACLDSIAAQTVTPDEVIVVDNNSSDRTSEIAQNYPFVTLLKEYRQGRTFARDCGFDAATSDIIARTDADMVLPRDWGAYIKEFYADAPHATTAWTCLNSFYNVRLPRLTTKMLHLLGFGLNRLLLGHDTLWGSSMALPRSQWQVVRSSTLKRPDIHEDLDLAIHIARSGGQVYLDKKKVVRAQLRRLNTDRQELWNYLLLWPQTYRANRIKSWRLLWLIVAFMRFVAVPLYMIFDGVLRLFGRKRFSV